MPLMPGATSFARPGACVRLIDDHELGAHSQKIVPASIGLDKVRRDNDVREPVENRLTDSARSFESGHGPRQNQLGIKMEFGIQLGLPLLCNLRRAQDCETPEFSSVDQFPNN